MSLRKNLARIVAGGLALGVVGCNDHEQYHYNDKIGDEQVEFYESTLGDQNFLDITRDDGTKIKYKDTKGDDLELESIYIIKNGETTQYRNDVIGEGVMEIGQSQFDGYLEEILRIKQTKGLNDIKKE